MEKDTYGRLSCNECGSSLSTRDPDDEIFKVKACPECGKEWKEL